MKKDTKYLLYAALASLLILLSVLLLQGVWSQADPDGRLAFQRLSQEIKEHPDREIYKLTRISNYPAHVIDHMLGEPDRSKSRIKYRSREKKLMEISDYLTQEWGQVTDEAIHAVAAENGTYPDLARYGCKDIHP